MDLETRARWSRHPHPGQKYRHGWIPVKGLLGLLERDGNVTDDTRPIFGGRFGGIGVQVMSGTTLDGRLRVSGRLTDRFGRKAGRVLRVLSRRDGQLVAEHHLRLELPKRPTASRVMIGVGGAVIGVPPMQKHTDTFAAHDFLQSYDAHLDRWYRATGVSLVETHATGDTAFYWALRGDQAWADGVPSAIVARLREWAASRSPLHPVRRAEARRMLARIDAGEVPSPYELASLVSGGDLFEGIPWVGVRRLEGV